MKAIRVNQWGQPIQLEDIPQPSPGRDEVLVRIRAASINPVDLVILAGYMKDYFSAPMTLGMDFAGEVVAVGGDVQHVKPGDAVYGMGAGAFAEYAAIKAQGVAHRPKSLDDIHAAAVPLAGLTAWQSLFKLAQVQPGERLLVHGAGGGVGSFAVQLAKRRGVYVIAHDRADKVEFLRSLGADQVIDASTQRFEDVAGSVDVVLDLVRDVLMERSFKVLKRGGRYVTPAAILPQDTGASFGIQVYSVYTQADKDDLAQLTEQIDAGKVKVFVHRTFPLEDVQAALALKQQGGVRGKLVIVVA